MRRVGLSRRGDGRGKRIGASKVFRGILVEMKGAAAAEQQQQHLAALELLPPREGAARSSAAGRGYSRL